MTAVFSNFDCIFCMLRKGSITSQGSSRRYSISEQPFPEHEGSSHVRIMTPTLGSRGQIIRHSSQRSVSGSSGRRIRIVSGDRHHTNESSSSTKRKIHRKNRSTHSGLDNPGYKSDTSKQNHVSIVSTL